MTTPRDGWRSSGAVTRGASADVGVVLLDTTVLIDVLRGRSVIERLRLLRSRADIAATSPIDVEEVVRGLRPDEQTAAARLFDGMLVIPLDRGIGERAGAWRRDYARQGTTLS